MIDLVTLEETKLFCRIDSDFDDPTVLMLIGAASAAVLDVADGWIPVVGEPIPDRIKLAVLTHVATAFDNRELAELPASAARLLNPMRRLEV